MVLQLCCWSRKSALSLPASVRSLLISTSIAPHRRWYSEGRDISIAGRTYPADSWSNVPASILSKYGKQLHTRDNHPLSITRKLIQSSFPGFKHHNDLPGVVTVHQNFDVLDFAADHPGRSRTDTYYVNKDHVLRTHTTAHEADLFRANLSDGYTICADVYRRDAVDRSHYPVFHQIEGALTWDRDALGSTDRVLKRLEDDFNKLSVPNFKAEDPNPTFHKERNPLQEQYHSPEEATLVAQHLKRSLENMVMSVFTEIDRTLRSSGLASVGSDEPLKVRWVEAFFPHTSPSWELEVWWRGDWLEVLGCGVIDQKLLMKAGVPNRLGWAFGLGLERIAMLLFGIPDIRLFWSEDARFLGQFDEKKPIQRYQPFSKYPAAPRDVAFWLPEKSTAVTGTPAVVSSTPNPAGGQVTTPADTAQRADFHENDLMEIVRDTAGDSVEDVSLVDDFTHPKTGRRSLCYRVTYRSLEKTLTNEEANALHDKVRQELVANFGVELR